MFLSSSAIPAYTPTRSISQISTDQRQLEEGAFHSLFSIHNETLDDAAHKGLSKSNVYEILKNLAPNAKKIELSDIYSLEAV